MRLPAGRVLLTAATATALAVPLLPGPLTTVGAATTSTGPAFIHGVLPPPPAGLNVCF